MKKNPTKKSQQQALRICQEYKASGNAGRRYKGDETDAWALACLWRLAQMPVAPEGLADRKKYVRQNGDTIMMDWYAIHPAMNLPTRPDQGFESRLLTNLALADDPIGWAWCKVDDEFHLMRTA